MEPNGCGDVTPLAAVTSLQRLDPNAFRERAGKAAFFEQRETLAAALAGTVCGVCPHDAVPEAAVLLHWIASEGGAQCAAAAVRVLGAKAGRVAAQVSVTSRPVEL